MWQRWCEGKAAESFTVDEAAWQSALANHNNKHPAPQSIQTQTNIESLSSLFYDGRYQELAEQATLFVAIQPGQGKAWHLLGLARLMLQENTAALEPLRQASCLLSEDAEIWDHLGVCNHRLGRFDEADLAYQRSLALAPDRPDAWSNAAKNANARKLFIDGERYAREALRLRPGFPVALDILNWALKGLEG
jgi:Flp pilus assembly protein TadD